MDFMDVADALRDCPACGEAKPAGQFWRRQSVCILCAKARYADYFAANKEQINARSRRNQQRRREADRDYTARGHLRYQYGMTLEEYDAKLVAQGGVCVICGSPPGRKRLHVDHDRECCPATKTCGKCVRDLLCHGCNNGSGIADNPELLRRRANYVEEWRARRLAGGFTAQAP